MTDTPYMRDIIEAAREAGWDEGAEAHFKSGLDRKSEDEVTFWHPVNWLDDEEFEAINNKHSTDITKGMK